MRMSFAIILLKSCVTMLAHLPVMLSKKEIGLVAHDLFLVNMLAAFYPLSFCGFADSSDYLLSTVECSLSTVEWPAAPRLFHLKDIYPFFSLLGPPPSFMNLSCNH